MVGNPQVIKSLQAALPLEAHLNIQYRTDQRVVKFMGVSKIAGKIKGFGDDAHLFQGKLQKQLMFLESVGTDSPINVNFTIMPIVTAPSITELLRHDLGLEVSSCTQYEDWAIQAWNNKDDETRNLFEHLIKWKHDHVRWLEKQLRLIKGLGENEYIAENM